MELPPIFRPCRRRSKRLLYLAASLLLVAGAAGVRAERLPVRTYTIADGLLRDGVTRIFQDSRGFLWFCTADGVSRFDGYGFTNFTTDDGLPERHVNDALELNDTIFFATGGGLARLNPTGARGSIDHPLFTVLSPDPEKPVAFNALFKENDDVILAGTDAGLYRVESSGERVRFENIPLGDAPDHPDVTAIFRDSKGVIWAGKFGRIIRIAPGEPPVVFRREHGVPTAGITRFAEDEKGRLWVAMRDFGGLLLLDRDAVPGAPLVNHVFGEREGLPSNWIGDILLTREGQMWLGTVGGLCQWEPDGNVKGGFACRRVYSGKNGLCEEGMGGLHEDNDGNIWLSGSCGTVRIARYGFTSYGKADGLGYPFAETLLESNSGELIATGRSGPRSLSRFTGENFEIVKLQDYPTNKTYGWGWQQTVMEDHVGDWWTATDHSLLRYRDPGRFGRLSSVTPEKMNAGAWPGEPFRIYEDSRGDVWVGTFGGPVYSLFRWERSTGKWHDHTKDAGLIPESLVSFLVEDGSGNLWIATGIDNGRQGLLIRYRDGRFTTFTEADGVPPGWMRDVHMDSQGRLWFANTSVGLLQLVDPNADGRLEFIRYGRGQGLSSNGIYCVVDDAMGRIYAGSGRGIDRLDPNTGTVENFTTSDGLASNAVEVAHRDRNGDLWFSTRLGLARLRPEPVRPREVPKALITGVHTPSGSKPISILGEAAVPTIDLVAHEGAIRIDFIGLGAALGEKLRYAYRLGDGSWNSTADRSVNIADLGAGDFQLEVRAITTDNLVSPPATVAFRVAPPFWQSGWFLALTAGLAALFVFVLVQNRIRRLVELERMRTRIATDLHDDIGANLTRIAMLSEVASRQSGNGGGQNLLPSIADIARESVESMNDIVWAISPDHDRLLDLIRRMRTHAEDVFTFRDIDLAFSAPDAETDLHLSVGVRRDLLLVFKEAVNNAARHSGCTRVEIDLRIENHRLTMIVADNGRGFNSNNGHDGQGLRSMRRRAKSLAGRLDIRSKMGDGTRVTFEIPLHRPAANKPSSNDVRS
jgi:signal transduction histidine kinase/ligand-binding sensor domain-containing protein